jgi:D-alanyl-D-alanine carboxypeptidase/D-alanyl-D-alanine-endopeptidase (penicillin-binding protein 4)
MQSRHRSWRGTWRARSAWALLLCLSSIAHAEPVADAAPAGSATPRSATTAPPLRESQALAILTDKLRARIDAAALGEGLSVSVIDLASGSTVVAHRADAPLNPASNQKLITAAIALAELGPSFRMRTGLYGEIQGEAVRGGLVLRGFGDPTLRASDLVALAQELVARGVRSVDEVIVDGSYFDDRVLPPAFEQQPNEIAPFRAAVAAVSVDANAYTLRILPGASEGAPAKVVLEGEGYFAVTNQIATRNGAPNVIAVQTGKSDKLALHLSGSVPPGLGMLSYRRRVESPLDYAGHVLIDALRALRVQVPRRVRVAQSSKGLRLLAAHASPPLAQVLASLGKDSDNFVAEMVFKVLAAERVRVPGRSEDAVPFVLEALKKRGVDTKDMAIVNGSGLFDGNHATAAQLTKLLSSMYADPAVRDEYVAHLAIGGVDGTLANRLAQLPAPRVVRAKTGTLNAVIALSGYVLGPTPDKAIAFSVLANGVAGKQQAARSLADQVAVEIAQHLWRAKAR